MSNLVVRDRDTLMGMLQRAQGTISNLLPKHMTPDKMLKMAMIAATKTPKLYECTQASLMKSVMAAAECGLNITGVDGQAYLVPYFNSRLKARECQLIIGYQGYLEMVRRSGQVSSVNSYVVYANDEYKVEFGSSPNVHHRPKLLGDRGAPVGAYAIARLKDGSTQLEFMTISEIEAIRNRSKAKDSGPWKTDYTEMCKKTVLRRLCKLLPKATERDVIATAMHADQEVEFNTIEIVPEPEPDNRVEALAEQIDANGVVESEAAEEPEQSAANAGSEQEPVRDDRNKLPF